MGSPVRLLHIGAFGIDGRGLCIIDEEENGVHPLLRVAANINRLPIPYDFRVLNFYLEKSQKSKPSSPVSIHTHPLTHSHTHTHTHLLTHPHTLTLTHAHTHTHTPTHTHTHTHPHTHTPPHTHIADFRECNSFNSQACNHSFTLCKFQIFYK